METEAQSRQLPEPGGSMPEMGVSTVATWLCLVGTIPLLALGLGRAAPLLLVAAAAFYVRGRFGWRTLLSRAWHYNDGDGSGAVFLTHAYVLVSGVVLLLLLLQLVAWTWSPVVSY